MLTNDKLAALAADLFDGLTDADTIAARAADAGLTVTPALLARPRRLAGSLALIANITR